MTQKIFIKACSECSCPPQVFNYNCEVCGAFIKLFVETDSKDIGNYITHLFNCETCKAKLQATIGIHSNI